MSNLFAKSIISKTDTTTNLSSLQTWAERIRVEAGARVSFCCWPKPKGTYTQLCFVAGQLAGIRPTSMDVEITTSISKGIVEGYTQENGHFVAMNIINSDGNADYNPQEAADILTTAGFTVSKVCTKNSVGLIKACIAWDGDPVGYDVEGVLVMVNDVDIQNYLNTQKNAPTSAIVYQFPVDSVVAEEAVVPAVTDGEEFDIRQKCWVGMTEDIAKEKSEDDAVMLEKIDEIVSKARVFDFYGKLPEKHAVYKAMVQAAGHIVSTNKADAIDYVVAFDVAKTTAKFPEAKVISVDDFLKLIKDDA